VVSAASLKIDGLFFLTGTVLGAGLFGESLPAFDKFWYTSFTERYLVSDWLGWSIGATLLAVVLMAIMMFYGAEKTEEYFRNKKTGAKMSWGISKRSYLFGASALVLISVIVLIIGQPSPERKWTLMEGKYSGMLSSRDVFIHPLEYIKTYNEASIKLVTLDLRPESEFNAFHLTGSENVKPEDFLDPKNTAPLQQLPAQGVVVLISDNDSVSVQAWKYLKVQGVNNIYIMDNGLHDWNKLFEGKTISGKSINISSPPSEVLQLFPKDAYTPKIKIITKKRSGGLCS
jgi:rhodanese-related sulfurtransferase